MATYRTTIVLPVELKHKLIALARERGISFGELVRRALKGAVSGAGHRPKRDPLLDDDAIFRGKGPRDMAENHDRYLYGD